MSNSGPGSKLTEQLGESWQLHHNLPSMRRGLPETDSTGRHTPVGYSETLEDYKGLHFMRTLTSAALALIAIITPVSAGAANWDSYSKSALSGTGMNDFSISFHCTELGTEFRIKHERFLGLHNRSVDVNMVTSWDDPQLNTVLRVLPHDDKVAYTSDAREIAEFLMGASSLHIFITPEFRNREYDLFGLDGSDYAIYRVFENCGEPLDGPRPHKPSVSPDTAKGKSEAGKVREKVKGLFGNPDAEKTDPKEATETAFQQWRGRYRFSDPDLTTYVKVTQLGPGSGIEVEWLEPSRVAGFDGKVSDTLKRMPGGVAAFETAPTDENGHKYFCMRVTREDAVVDYECNYTKPKKPINSRVRVGG